MIAFLHPLALLGLVALPVLWIILKFLPPLPKKIFLPTARFLLGLESRQSVPQTAPWWLILLRLSILTALILAFAGPVLHPQKISDTAAPLRLVFDNGWASAQNWDMQMARAEDILQKAAQANRPVELLLTASKAPAGFMRGDEALRVLKAAEPMPWPGLPDKLKASVEAQDTFWVSSGVAEPGFYSAAENFLSHGRLTVFVPDMKERPALLRGPSEDAPSALLRVEIPSGAPARSVSLQAYDRGGKIIHEISKNITGQSGGADIMDESFSGKGVQQWKSPGIAGAGGVFLNDRQSGGGLYGIVAMDKPSENADFSSASFYLSRAIEKFAKVETGSIEELIRKGAAVIVLPDIADFAPGVLSDLEKWIKGGGIVLRFGGKAMSEADNMLVPVPLKTGMRALSGELAWTQPLKMAAFPKTSPFAGQKTPDITVENQLLAEPSADLESHVWAQLSDGTPVITAKAEGRGLLILVHTTATPAWSDFVLSGFYVSFLKDVLDMAALPDKATPAPSSLQPLFVLDGWGRLKTPGAAVKPIEKDNLAAAVPSETNPPGFYGDAMRSHAFNLGDHIGLDMVERLPSGAKTESLKLQTQETRLAAAFFTLAAILFLIDWLVHIVSARGFVRYTAAVLLLLIPLSAQAQDAVDKSALIHLACVKSDQDKTCKDGLQNLSNALKARTSTEIGDAVTIDPESDDLSFYPLLYWPVDSKTSLSAKARDNLAHYIGKGGMIMIDTQTGDYNSATVLPDSAILQLREALKGIDIPPLKPAPKNHVLFKSFYLVNIYPEFDLTGKIWVEDDSIEPEDGLSSVIVTGQDLMHRWAYPASRTDAEMALRFGINLVLYSLTGNYKADQVHMKTILERMGDE